MEDLPKKVSKKDFGGMSEILEAIKKCQTPEKIKDFYKTYVSKIKKEAEKQANGDIMEKPEKYACANIKFCFDNLKIENKKLIFYNWEKEIPGLSGAYLEESL